MTWLTAYPFATASSAAFYLLMLACAIPRLRSFVAPLFTHPIPLHQKYLLGFDALRGFAAALVAIAHCWWSTYPVFASTQLSAPFLAYGSKGVPIFIVLSGFLIYRSALGALGSTDKLRVFAVRRFFRIYPVYFLGVILCLVTGQYVGSEHISAISYVTSDLFMLNVLNWPAGYANPPTWSLYVEVAFYAFLPITLIVVPRRKILLFSVIGIIVLILADYESRVFGLWKYFLFGILASEVSAHIPRRSAAAIFFCGIVLLVIDFQGPRFDWVARIGIGRLHMDGESIGLGIACGLILTTLPSLPKIGAALNIIPLRMIGVISYSVYVTHVFYIKANFPEIGLFTQMGTEDMYRHFSTLPAHSTWYLPLVFFPGILFWGCISFLLVERPGMQFGRYLINGRRAAATVCMTGRS